MNFKLFIHSLTPNEVTELKIILFKLSKSQILNDSEKHLLKVFNYDILHKASARLRNVIHQLINDGVLYVEDCNEEMFLNVRGCGIKTWKEFQILIYTYKY